MRTKSITIMVRVVRELAKQHHADLRNEVAASRRIRQRPRRIRDNRITTRIIGRPAPADC